MIYHPYHVKKMTNDHLWLFLFQLLLYSPSFLTTIPLGEVRRHCIAIFDNNPTMRSSQTLHCTFVKKLLWSLSHPLLLLWITHLNVSCMGAHHICIHMLKAQAGERGFSIWWLMHVGKSLFGYSHILV
jgi:hypothetical protein